MEPNEQNKASENAAPATEPVPTVEPKSTAQPESNSEPEPTTQSESNSASAPDSTSIDNPASAAQSTPSSTAEPTTDSSESNNKIGLFVGLGVAALVIVAGVAAALLIPQMLTPDYNKMAEATDNLYDSLSDYFYSSACHEVSYYVDDNYYADASEYSELIENCKKDAAKVYGDISRFELESGVSKDPEINNLYIKFKEAFNENAPGSNKLESTLRLYESVHNFVLEMDELDDRSDSLPTPDEFSKVTDHLINSGNEDLKAFGEGLNLRYDKVYKAYQAYSEADYSDSNYTSLYDAMSDARDEFSDYLEEQSDYIYDLDFPLADLSDDDDDSVMNTFDEMQSAIVLKING